MSVGLISVDVGGTLTDVVGPTATNLLTRASPLPTPVARRLLRRTLQVSPEVTRQVIDDVCSALAIDPTNFPYRYKSPRSQVSADAAPALAILRACAPVVTLSNVSPLDTDLGDLLAADITARYRSCDLGYAKPDHRAFEKVAHNHGVELWRLVHIGDDWECDVLGAARAGSHAVWLSKGRNTPPVPEDGAASRITVVADLLAAARYVIGVAGRDRQADDSHSQSRQERCP